MNYKGALANILEDQVRHQAFRQLKLPQGPLEVTEERDKSKAVEGRITLGVLMLLS